MTNISMNSNIERTPFLLAPTGKDYLWGGTRLKDDFSKDLGMEPLAESWECSTHPDGQSLVASGRFQGERLIDVLERHPEFIGTHPRMKDGLPILIKFIDARNDLSIQVHPTDEYADEHENGSLGKTEMWYVVEASKDAHLIYGLKKETDRETVRESLKNGTILDYLNKVPVKKGNVFFIPAGQVHAICSGCLVAEVQESSNITYRLYDYDRIDKDGNKRALHIEKALEVVNYKKSMSPRQPMRVMRFQKGMAVETLCLCQYFLVEKVTLDTQRCREYASFRTESNSFSVFLCIEGCGTMRWDSGELDFFRGDCVFVPAGAEESKVHGEAKLLKVSC